MKKYLLIIIFFSMFVNLNKGFCTPEKINVLAHRYRINTFITSDVEDEEKMASFNSNGTMESLKFLMQNPDTHNYKILVRFFDKITHIAENAKKSGALTNTGLTFFQTVSSAFTTELNEAMRAKNTYTKNQEIKQLAYFELTLSDFINPTPSKDSSAIIPEWRLSEEFARKFAAFARGFVMGIIDYSSVLTYLDVMPPMLLQRVFGEKYFLVDPEDRNRIVFSLTRTGDERTLEDALYASVNMPNITQQSRNLLLLSYAITCIAAGGEEQNPIRNYANHYLEITKLDDTRLFESIERIRALR